VAVQISRKVGPDVGEDESFTALHCNGCQGHWSVVIEAPDCLLLGNGEYCGGFKACGYYTLLQGQVEDVGEHCCWLVCECLRCAASSPVCSCCFGVVNPPQSGSHLVMLEDEYRLLS